MTTASGLHSQERIDTVQKMWINRQDALRKLAQADSARTLKKIVQEKQKDIDTLSARINILKEVISEYKEKEVINFNVVNSYEKQIIVLNSEKEIYKQQVFDFEKLLRKEKRKKKWTAISGIVTTAGAIWLGMQLR